MVNNTKRRLKWALDLSKSNSVLDNGIFKFLHPGGMPYLTYGDRGINGELDPGEAKPLQVLFCPGETGFLLFMLQDMHFTVDFVACCGLQKSFKILLFKRSFVLIVSII